MHDMFLSNVAYFISISILKTNDLFLALGAFRGAVSISFDRVTFSSLLSLIISLSHRNS